MKPAPFRIELLEKHDRSAFDCGSSALDTYFQKQVSQDVRRHYATCFVAIEKETDALAGFYTLAMSSVALDDLPEETAKRLPRYPRVPVARIGRLAVDKRFQGMKLGSSLLADAITRSVQAEVAAYAIVVDAKDNRAAAFYKQFGFVKLSSSPKTLFLPVSKALKKLADS